MISRTVKKTVIMRKFKFDSSVAILNLGTVELLPDFFLNDVPSLPCVRQDTLRAVLHLRGQGGIIARTVEEKEGAVAEET
jgi:hypothetical protein